MWKEDAAVDMEARTLDAAPGRADEIAEAVNRTDRRAVERADERGARQVRRMMFDETRSRLHVHSSRPSRSAIVRPSAPIRTAFRARSAIVPLGRRRSRYSAFRQRWARGSRDTAKRSTSLAVSPPIRRHSSMASEGNPATCLMRANRSSSTAATSWPSRTRTADTSPWYALRPMMFTRTLPGRTSTRPAAARRWRRSSRDDECSSEKCCCMCMSAAAPMRARSAGSEKSRTIAVVELLARVAVDNQSVDSVPDDLVGRSVDCDAGFPGPHGLEIDQAEPLTRTGHHEERAARVQIRQRPIIDAPQERDRVTKSTRPGSTGVNRRFEPRPVVAVARDDEFRGRHAWRTAGQTSMSASWPLYRSFDDRRPTISANPSSSSAGAPRRHADPRRTGHDRQRCQSRVGSSEFTDSELRNADDAIRELERATLARADPGPHFDPDQKIDDAGAATADQHGERRQVQMKHEDVKLGSSRAPRSTSFDSRSVHDSHARSRTSSTSGTHGADARRASTLRRSSSRRHERGLSRPAGQARKFRQRRRWRASIRAFVVSSSLDSRHQDACAARNDRAVADR